jgi:exonuclease SbcC
MKLNKIEIKNFQSLGDISYSFSDGLTLIDGYNFDLNSANGAGKSSLINSITYALYGKVPKAVNLSELIRDGVTEEGLATQITIEVGDQTVEIQRTRTQTSGKVALKIDGKKVDGLAKEIESKILELLGFSFEQFIQVVYVFQGATNRFISLNDTEKKRFLSTLFNLESFDGAYKKAHEELNQLELDLSKLNGSIEAHTLRLPQLSSQRSSLESVTLGNSKLAL